MKKLFVTAVALLLCVPAAVSAFSIPGTPKLERDAIRYCTDGGVTYYCTLILTGHPANGLSCSIGDVSVKGPALEGSNYRELEPCLRFCSNWACLYSKDQQESSGKPVVGSRCCNSSSWSKTQ